jgi:hypothetical protein
LVSAYIDTFSRNFCGALAALVLVGFAQACSARQRPLASAAPRSGQAPALPLVALVEHPQASASATEARQVKNAIVLRPGAVLDLDAGKLLAKREIVIDDGGRIVAVGTNLELPADAPVIEAPSSWTWSRTDTRSTPREAASIFVGIVRTFIDHHPGVRRRCTRRGAAEKRGSQ